MVKLVVLSQVEIPDSLWNIIWVIIFKWDDQFERKKSLWGEMLGIIKSGLFLIVKVESLP